MRQVSASAPGKIILFGEHAVVYGRPAIAIPVNQVRAVATVSEADGTAAVVDAGEIGLHTTLANLSDNNPLALAIHGTRLALNLDHLPPMHIRISSTIPVAAGLGSGAAVSVAVVRALAAYLQRELEDEQINQIAFRVEQRLHGTPSGIDNSVVTYERPVYFQRGTPLQTVEVASPLTFVIADTGVKSPTATAVSDVRSQWQAHTEVFEERFSQIGAIVEQARQALKTRPLETLGTLMDANQALLRQIGVSSVELDRLVEVAHAAGAAGAKLSGGGRGGNMIALAQPEQAGEIAATLMQAGATRTIITRLEPTG